MRHFSTNEKACLCLSKHESKHQHVDQNFHNSVGENQSGTESVIISRLSGIFLRLFMMRHTIFLSGQLIGSHIGSVSWNIQHILWLISSFKQRDVCARFWSVFKVGEHVSIIFSIHRFLRSSRYFSSIVISINFYHVECGDGRQPRILVDNFWIPRSKTCTFSTPRFLAGPCSKKEGKFQVMYFATLNMHWLSEIKLKHCRYYSKQRKFQMRKANTKQHKKTQEKLINLKYFLFFLWWLVLWFLSSGS